MRTSSFLIATQKETPADAEIVSHQLMLRAGLVRKLAAGLYSWLPLGLRVLRKVGDTVSSGEALAILVHDDHGLAEAIEMATSAYTIAG